MNNEPRGSEQGTRREAGGRVVGPPVGAGAAEPSRRNDVISLVSRLSQQIVALSADLAADMGVHPTDVNALHMLGAAVEPMTVTELGAALDLSSAATTGLVDRLEQSGLASRQRDDDDRRRVLIGITEVAHATSMEHLAPMFERLVSALDDADDAELEVIVRFLTTLVRPAPPPAGRPVEPSPTDH